MKKKRIKLIELKRKLEEAGIETKHLVYMPEVPMVGIDKSYVIEEWYGVKVAKIISPGDN